MWPEIVLQVLTVLQPHDRTIGKTEEEKEDERKRRGKERRRAGISSQRTDLCTETHFVFLSVW